MLLLRLKHLRQWLLPEIYDSIYEQKTENIVYIKASRNESIKNVEDMILAAHLHIAGTNTSLVLEEGIDLDSRILHMDLENGAKVKGKVYFKYENGIGYRITFMATHATYEKNLPFYEDFISSLIFEKNH